MQGVELIAVARLHHTATLVKNYFQNNFIKPELHLDATLQTSVDCAAMAKISIQAPAIAVGIKNANQLRKALKCPLSTAYALWSEKATSLHIDTLLKLCQAFKCSADVIIKNNRKKGR